MPQKACTKCGLKKSLDDFQVNRNHSDGRQSWCRSCMREWRRQHYYTNREAENARSRAAYAANRDRRRAANRDAHLRRKYGITTVEYDALLKKQRGMCAICGGTDTCGSYANAPDGRRLAVDHCHETGHVRGLLCGTCNRLLGLFGDDPSRFRRAARYLSH